MPSTYSVSKARPLLSSTVITPSLPTLSITSAIRSPISSSAAEIVAMWAMSSLVLTSSDIFLIDSTTASRACSMPRLISIGLAPAATIFKPSLTIICASTVAVVVPSPAMSLVFVAASFRSCAPLFSYGSLSSISLATVTPSWVIVGAPNFLSSATLRPLGPSVVATAIASISMPAFNERRASSLNVSCLAIFLSLSLLDYGEDIGFFEDEELPVFDLDFRAGVLGEEDDVALLHVHRDALAVVVGAAGADGQDLAFLRLLFRRLRQDDAAGRLLLFFERVDDHAVAQRLEVHLQLAGHATDLLSGVRCEIGDW